MAASITIDDGTNPPVTGSVDLDVSFLATAFTLSNFDDTGVLGWRWTLLDRPTGSSAVLSSTTAASINITPDVEGTYFIRLETFTDAGRTQLDDNDEQVIGIRYATPLDWLIPAAGQTTQLGGLRGWAEQVNEILRETHDGLAFEQLLNAPTGDEVGFAFTLEVDKSTSGDYTGLLLDITETNAPGVGDVAWEIQVGGTPIWQVDNTGTLITGNITPSFPLLAPDGAAAAPSYSFSGATNYGMYRSGSELRLAVNATDAMRIFSTSVINEVPVAFPNGSAVNPSLHFESDTNTGLFRDAADNIGFTTAGVEAARFIGSLVAATGDETAFSFAATVNKATSGNYTGFNFNVTETAAPGTGNRLWNLQIGGADRFWAESDGDFVVWRNLTIGEQNGINRVGLDVPAAGQMGLLATGARRLTLTGSALLPVAIGTFDLGGSSLQFGEVYATQYLAEDGVDATPSYGFNDEAGLGIRRSGAGQLSFIAGSLRRFYMTSSGFFPNADNSVDIGTSALAIRDTYTNQVLVGDGTAAAPGVAFMDDPNTGMYRTATNLLLVRDGSAMAAFNRAGHQYIADQINQATGDEVAFNFSTTVNKATSGNYTAIEVNVTETSAPGVDDRLFDIKVGGTSVWTVDNTGTLINGTVPGGVSFPLLAPNGSAGAPSYSFSGGTNYGMYFTGSALSFSTGGSEKLRIAANQLAIVPAGSAAAPSLDLAVGGQTGLYYPAAGRFGITTDGVAAAIVEGQLTAASGDEVSLALTPTVNKAAGNYRALQINVTETAAPGVDDRLVDLQVGGVSQMWIDNSGYIRAPEGAAGTPGITGTSSQATGLYWSSGDLVISVNGTARVTHTAGLTTYAQEIEGVTGNETDPMYAFTDEGGLGLYRSGAGQLAFAVSSQRRAYFDSTGFIPHTNGTYNLGDSTHRWDDLHLAGTVFNTRNNATGDEILFAFDGTVNKATSGNYTGIEVNITETSAPGVDDRLLDLQVGGVSQMYVSNAGQVLASFGSASAPGFSFVGDTDTGLTLSGLGGALRMSIGGTARFQFDTGALAPLATATYDLGSNALRWDVLYLDVGAVATPSISVGETTVGLYRPAASQLGLAANSEAVIVDNDAATPSFRPDANDVWVLGEAALRWNTGYFNDGALATPALSVGETDCGLYQPAADQIGLAANSESVIFDNDSATASLRPNANNTIALGEESFKYTTVWSVTLDTGDINLKSLHDEGHWTINEDSRGLYAHNRINGKSYRLMMQECPDAPEPLPLGNRGT